MTLRNLARIAISASLFLVASCADDGSVKPPARGTDSAAREGTSDRNVLWSLVHDCLDPAGKSDGGTCREPRRDGISTLDRLCATSLQVWAGERGPYVAIRDLKMCGCADGFVHGLVLPFAKISGVEAADLPETIWPFAWDVAREHIADDSTIALVVNPPGRERSQDQLHIHLVRLCGDVDGLPKDRTTTIPNLDHVWETARSLAERLHLDHTYGILVAGRPGAQSFTVLVDDKNPELRYTRYTCTGAACTVR